MSGLASGTRRRLDLVHHLNAQNAAWRSPLVAPSVRASDGLAADSPMGWQGVPWWRHVGVRGPVFLLALVAAWAAVNGLWLLAQLHVGVTWYLPVVFELIPAVAAYAFVVTALEAVDRRSSTHRSAGRGSFKGSPWAPSCAWS